VTAGPGGSDWSIERPATTAAALHDRAWPDPVHRQVWIAELSRPALVLGSTQSEDIVDRAAVSRDGVEVVRRRSGGGAVFLDPGNVVWVDLILPRGDRLWDDDAGRAPVWVGEAWAEALAAIGAGRSGGSALSVSRAPLARTALGSLICFAAVGPGEVLVNGRKAVGISQRRTRAGARFQCLVQLDGTARGAARILDYLVAPPEGPDRESAIRWLTASVWRAPAAAAHRLLAALLAALP
jgi:lipoate-protein ligase A